MSEETTPTKPYSLFLLGAGLLASVFWFGGGERKLPREFGSFSALSSSKRAKLVTKMEKHLRSMQDHTDAAGASKSNVTFRNHIAAATTQSRKAREIKKQLQEG